MLAKTRFLLIPLGVSSSPLWACPQCRPAVEAGVYNAQFAPNFAILMLPLALIVGLALAVYRWK